MNARLKVGTILAGAAVAATSMFGGAASAAGGNLVVNGDLSPNTDGWAVSGVGTFTSIIGFGGRLTSTEATLGESSIVASQCVAIDDEHEYRLTGSHFSQLEQDRTGWGYYLARFHTGPDCTGQIPDQKTQGIEQTASWQHVDISLTRTSGVPVKSVTIALVAKKDATNRLIKKAGTFSIFFKDLGLYGEPISQPGSAQEEPAGDDDCLCAPAGGEDGDDAPGHEGEPLLPINPVKPTGGDKPTLQPLEPTRPVPPVKEPVVEPEPDFPLPAGDEPSDSPSQGGSDEPASPPAPSSGNDGSHDQPSTGSGTNKPTNDGAQQPRPALEPQKPGLPQAADGTPTLEPQGPGPINAASPTPPPPATGGDNRLDPAENLSSGEGDSSEVERSGNHGGSGMPLPVLGGGAAGLVALLGLRIILKRASRS